MCTLSVLALSILPSVATTQGRVLVVDSAGGGAFTDIQPAVDDATHGDTLLVKSGTYGGFNLVNRGVAVVADEGAVVQVNGTVQVRNLAADRDVLLGRLRIAGATGSLDFQGTGLYLKNDVGSVRVQSCELLAAPRHPGARIEGSLDVSLSDCRAFGGDGGGMFEPECSVIAGVIADGSSVATYFGELRGGAGGVHNCLGCSGGSALSSATSSFLHVAGALLTGGHGADGNDNCAGNPDPNQMCHGGYGGHGVEMSVLGYSSEVHTYWGFDNSFAPGNPGVGGHGWCGCGLSVECDADGGEPGSNLHHESNDIVQTLPRETPLLEVAPNPAREQSTVLLSFQGPPNTKVLLATGARTGFRTRPGQGVQLVPAGWPHLFQIVGTTNAFGRLHEGWQIPELGAGVESRVVHLQPVFVDASGAWTWGSPVGLVMLDQAF